MQKGLVRDRKASGRLLGLTGFREKPRAVYPLHVLLLVAEFLLLMENSNDHHRVKYIDASCQHSNDAQAAETITPRIGAHTPSSKGTTAVSKAENST